MGMAISQIQELIKAAIPDAKIAAEDLSGDGTHYAVSVEAASFGGLSEIKQRQIVALALQGHLGGDLHGVALQTLTCRAGQVPKTEAFRYRPFEPRDLFLRREIEAPTVTDTAKEVAARRCVEFIAIH